MLSHTLWTNFMFGFFCHILPFIPITLLYCSVFMKQPQKFQTYSLGACLARVWPYISFYRPGKLNLPVDFFSRLFSIDHRLQNWCISRGNLNVHISCFVLMKGRSIQICFPYHLRGVVEMDSRLSQHIASYRINSRPSFSWVYWCTILIHFWHADDQTTRSNAAVSLWQPGVLSSAPVKQRSGRWPARTIASPSRCQYSECHDCSSVDGWADCWRRMLKAREAGMTIFFVTRLFAITRHSIVDKCSQSHRTSASWHLHACRTADPPNQ
jgi:hypothetical protein